MLIVWFERFVILLVVLTTIYLGLSFYKRWEERRRLVAEFEARETDASPSDADKKAFLDKGMNAYERSLKKKLLLGVYLVPLALLVLLVVVAQWG